METLNLSSLYLSYGREFLIARDINWMETTIGKDGRAYDNNS